MLRSATSALYSATAPLRSTAVPASFNMLRSASFWADVPLAPKDPILGISEMFVADPDPSKMNLGVGAYRDDNGKPVVLDCVREAERRISGRGLLRSQLEQLQDTFMSEVGLYGGQKSSS